MLASTPFGYYPRRFVTGFLATALFLVVLWHS